MPKKNRVVPVKGGKIYACQKCGRLVALLNKNGKGKYRFVDAKLHAGHPFAFKDKPHPCWAAERFLASPRGRKPIDGS